MEKLQLLDGIRTLVRETMQRYGAPMDHPVCETMLIHNGFFCGRQFDSAGYHAVWFMEENEIKFYDQEGSILQVLALTAARLDDRKAA